MNIIAKALTSQLTEDQMMKVKEIVNLVNGQFKLMQILTLLISNNKRKYKNKRGKIRSMLELQQISKIS